MWATLEVETMKVKYLVQRAYKTIHPYSGIDYIRQDLTEDSFLVVMDNGSFLGIITPSDVVELPHQLAIDCLRQKPRLDSEQDTQSVIKLMKESRNHVLPVFKKNEFLGVTTETVIMEYLLESRKEVEETISERTTELKAANEQLQQEVDKRKQAEQALRENEERFKQVAESAGEWIWEVDADGLYTYASPVVEKILGYKPEELVGKKHFYDLFTPDVRDQLKDAAFEVVARKEAFRNFFNPNVHKHGHTVILETSGLPVLDVIGNLLGYRGADTDITERKQAEEAMGQYREKMAVLKERERLARELHDSMTQSMYSLVLFAEAGRQLAEVGNLQGVQQHMVDIAALARQTIKEMRLLLYELRPPEFERGGLIVSLRRRLNAVEKQAGMEARLIVEGSVELPLTVEEELNRIAQEALNNVLKHAAATSVTVHLRVEGEQVVLAVEDDGRGFDPDVVSALEGMGLIGIRQRTEKLGGIFNVASVPGQGTRLQVQVNMTSSAARQSSEVTIGNPYRKFECLCKSAY